MSVQGQAYAIVVILSQESGPAGLSVQSAARGEHSGRSPAQGRRLEPVLDLTVLPSGLQQLKPSLPSRRTDVGSPRYPNPSTGSARSCTDVSSCEMILNLALCRACLQSSQRGLFRLLA